MNTIRYFEGIEYGCSKIVARRLRFLGDLYDMLPDLAGNITSPSLI
jgi:hypothetical protein